MDPKSNIDAILRSLRPYGLYQVIQMGYILFSLMQVVFVVLIIVYVGK